jgi:hypothetical protein
MAHPYFHSVSSTHRWGGTVDDYLLLHSWFDASKQLLCDFRHRALRHHQEGVELACRIFGQTLTNSDNVAVSIFEIGEQHVREDLGHLPRIAEWFSEVDNSCLSKPRRLNWKTQSLKSFQQWGGHLEDYSKIHQFLDECLGKVKCSFAFRHHSLGIFDCEAVFGPVIHNSAGRPIPVRVIAEQHIKNELGTIPATHDFIKTIKPEAWMMKVAKPSKMILREAGSDQQEVSI